MGLMDSMKNAVTGKVGDQLASQNPLASQLLGQERIQQISGKLGMDPGTVKTKLAEVLPGLVDKMTPNGKVEQDAA